MKEITVNVQHVEAALRSYLADLDYDLHKSIERDEETGEDTYHLEAVGFMAELRLAVWTEELT